MVPVKYSDLDLAMDFVSSGAIIDAQAYVSRKTGVIFYQSDETLDEEENPDNLGDINLYAPVPDKSEFDLGRSLVFEFASELIPEHHDAIAKIFRHRGAYARYKDFLYEHDLSDQWYQFEANAIKTALSQWADEEQFTLV